MQTSRLTRWCSLSLLLLGLQSASAQDTTPARKAPALTGPKLHVSQRSLATLASDRSLGLEVNAGVISRVRLREELARGVARFLGQVRAEPAFERGRFMGWRVLALFAKRPDIRVLVLRPGDTVLRVNGRSVERPEDLQAVWTSLSDARELVLDIRRDAQPSRLRYTIAD